MGNRAIKHLNLGPDDCCVHLIASLSPCSGYDFGYMVKLLTDSRLPEEEHEFFHILNLFFPSIYDVKYLMKSCKNLKVHDIFFPTIYFLIIITTTRQKKQTCNFALLWFVQHASLSTC